MAIMKPINMAKPTTCTSPSLWAEMRLPLRTHSKRTNISRPPSRGGMGRMLTMPRLMLIIAIHSKIGDIPALATSPVTCAIPT